MSDEKKYTLRDLVIARREGYAQGATWYKAGRVPLHEVVEQADNYYPLPKVTRPREVRDSHGVEWRWGWWGFEFRDDGDGCWSNVATSGTPGITKERVLLLADLLANPTEEVEK